MRQYECLFHVGDTVMPMKPEDPSDGPGWSDGMGFMIGNVYTISDITWDNGYYLVRLGESLKERMWYWKDTWVQPVDYSLF